nr:hypothetical protein [Tanacetum cinerariifolium]
SQQRKSWTKKQKRDYYMAMIRNNLGWKVKDFKGMTFEEVEAKFNSVCKQMEDFIPMGSKEEAKKIKRKEVPEEKVKEMMNLVPIEEVQRQRNLYACREGLPSEEGSSTCDDLLQTSSGELLTDVIKFPLVEEVPTASIKGCHCQKKCESTARKIALLC